MDRRHFLGVASTLGFALSIPRKLMASQLPADVTELIGANP
jgi:hypothetical protein